MYVVSLYVNMVFHRDRQDSKCRIYMNSPAKITMVHWSVYPKANFWS